MTISFILSGLLVLIAALGLLQRAYSPFVGACTPLIAAAGIYLVWRPEDASHVANMLGVGRGADLVFYVWTLLSLFMLLGVYLKIQRYHEQLTGLARAIALHEAEKRL